MKLTRRTQGFTLVEIMIVVAIIGILIAIAVPGFVRARTESRIKGCTENLTKLDGAKEQWALENNKTTADTPQEADLYIADGSLYLKSEPICPSDSSKSFATSYSINAVGTAPACLIDPANHHL